MPRQIAGIDVHKKMLAVVVVDAAEALAAHTGRGLASIAEVCARRATQPNRAGRVQPGAPR